MFESIVEKIKSASEILKSGNIKTPLDAQRLASDLRKIADEIQVGPVQTMPPMIHDLIENLNGDLAREYSALIQYVQHAASIVGPGFESFIPTLKEHAGQEFEHAKMLAEKINYLGGVPILFATPIQAAMDPKDMLLHDLVGEREAIQRYKERIAQAEAAGEFGIKHMLEQILLEEEDHENDLLSILGLERNQPLNS